jgi:hypothetical protein
MNQRQAGPIRLLVLVLAVFLTCGASCGPVAKGIEGLSGATDDAGRMVSHAADASELRAASTKLDDYLKDVPSGTSLSPEEQSLVDLATQRSAAFKQIADMLGVADGVKDLISKDSVLLVTGSIRRDPGPEFRSKLDEAAEKILKNTTCSIAADEANRQLVKPTSSPTASRPNPYADLTKAVTSANYVVSTVQNYVDLAGLSSSILSKASGYVGKAKGLVTAASWNNGGAFQAYVHMCLLR